MLQSAIPAVETPSHKTCQISSNRVGLALRNVQTGIDEGIETFNSISDLSKTIKKVLVDKSEIATRIICDLYDSCEPSFGEDDKRMKIDSQRLTADVERLKEIFMTLDVLGDKVSSSMDQLIAYSRNNSFKYCQSELSSCKSTMEYLQRADEKYRREKILLKERNDELQNQIKFLQKNNRRKPREPDTAVITSAPDYISKKLKKKELARLKRARKEANTPAQGRSHKPAKTNGAVVELNFPVLPITEESAQETSSSAPSVPSPAELADPADL